MKSLASKVPAMIAALIAVAALTVTLVARLACARESATSGGATSAGLAAAMIPPAPAAFVPTQQPVLLSSLEAPCWACTGAAMWPARFRIDLDRLAPLGTGRGNAAVWLVAFSRGRGDTVTGWDREASRRFAGGKRVLPADDPALREAEAWVDQASMRFYPELLAVRARDLELPNLLYARLVARSWVVRGRRTTDPTSALADYRRAIRLGRLLRQEDVIVEADLVGLECIREGLQGIYDSAIAREDAPLALIAALALGEVAPQRSRTAERLTEIVVVPRYEPPADPRALVRALREDRLAKLIAVARRDPERRFRREAILQLGYVRLLGTREQEHAASACLDALAHERDPVIAEIARASRDGGPISGAT